jgi:hypothetical protein
MTICRYQTKKRRDPGAKLCAGAALRRTRRAQRNPAAEPPGALIIRV